MFTKLLTDRFDDDDDDDDDGGDSDGDDDLCCICEGGPVFDNNNNNNVYRLLLSLFFWLLSLPPLSSPLPSRPSYIVSSIAQYSAPTSTIHECRTIRRSFNVVPLALCTYTHT